MVNCKKCKEKVRFNYPHGSKSKGKPVHSCLEKDIKKQADFIKSVYNNIPNKQTETRK